MSDTPDKPACVRPPGSPCCHWLLVLIVLAAGVGIGLGIGRMQWYEPPRTGPRNVEEIREKWVDRVKENVDLTDEQAEQVGRIVEQRVAAFWKIREEFRPRFKVEFDLMCEEVGAVLDQDQLPAWNAYCDQRRQRYFGTPTTQPADE